MYGDNERPTHHCETRQFLLFMAMFMTQPKTCF